jgi:hypothetical protein
MDVRIAQRKGSTRDAQHTRQDGAEDCMFARDLPVNLARVYSKKLDATSTGKRMSFGLDGS